jgi:hypothetical protein
VACLDEMGPLSARTLSARSYLGREPVRTQSPPAGRAKQEVDYGRRGKGYIFGAFCPATGAAFTRPYPGRSTGNWVAFLGEVDNWLPADLERVYAIADNLGTHRATDVLLFMRAHPRWEIDGVPAEIRRLPQPDRAVVEDAARARPRRAAFRDLGRGGRGGRPGDGLLECAPPRHPFVWGRRRRHRPRRQPGIALLPKAA